MKQVSHFGCDLGHTLHPRSFSHSVCPGLFVPLGLLGEAATSVISEELLVLFVLYSRLSGSFATLLVPGLETVSSLEVLFVHIPPLHIVQEGASIPFGSESHFEAVEAVFLHHYFTFGCLRLRSAWFAICSYLLLLLPGTTPLVFQNLAPPLPVGSVVLCIF